MHNVCHCGERGEPAGRPALSVQFGLTPTFAFDELIGHSSRIPAGGQRRNESSAELARTLAGRGEIMNL
jgi:hypothetical protein